MNQFIYLFTFFLSSLNCTAQIIGANAFAKTNLIEVGINSCGTFGAEGIPADFTNPTDSFRSIICDYDLNGWNVGTPPFFGDLISDVFREGFFFQRGAGTGIYNYFNSDYTCANIDILGEITDYIDYGDSISIIWTSDLPSAEIIQTTTLYQTKRYILNTITIKNLSSKANQDIFYVRDVLPSPEMYIDDDFQSLVSVDAQYAIDGYTLISATGLTYNSYFSIGSNNPRAFSGFYEYWLDLNGDENYSSFSNSPYYYDSGSDSGYLNMNLGFKQPQLMKDSTVSFSFAYIFSPDEIEEAIAKTGTSVVYETCIYPPIEIENIYIGAIELSSEYGAGMVYEMEYKLSGTATYTFVEATDYEELIWLVGLLEPCTEYSFRLSAIGEMDTCVTEIYNVKTQCTDGIAFINDSNWNIFPNPASSAFTIQTNGLFNAQSSIIITDVNGSTFYTTQINAQQNQILINTSNFAAGMYMATIITNNGVYSKPFVIINK